MKDLLIGDSTNFWGMSLYSLPKNNVIPIIEFINLFYKSLPLFAALSGLFVGIIFYYFNIYNLFLLKKKETFQLVYLFFNKKWFFDRVYNQLLTQNFLYYGYYFSYKDLDRGILELIGPHGLIDNLQKSFEDIKNYQSGEIFYYLAIFFVVLLTIIFFVLFTY
jgi:NADH-ubiquinone oxidoreductase chain 5